jgi:hypothetical protein
MPFWDYLTGPETYTGGVSDPMMNRLLKNYLGPNQAPYDPTTSMGRASAAASDILNPFSYSPNVGREISSKQIPFPPPNYPPTGMSPGPAPPMQPPPMSPMQPPPMSPMQPPLQPGQAPPPPFVPPSGSVQQVPPPPPPPQQGPLYQPYLNPQQPQQGPLDQPYLSQLNPNQQPSPEMMQYYLDLLKRIGVQPPQQNYLAGLS